jgi:hypothetical protein
MEYSWQLAMAAQVPMPKIFQMALNPTQMASSSSSFHFICPECDEGILSSQIGVPKAHKEVGVEIFWGLKWTTTKFGFKI